MLLVLMSILPACAQETRGTIFGPRYRYPAIRHPRRNSLIETGYLRRPLSLRRWTGRQWQSVSGVGLCSRFPNLRATADGV